MRGGPLSAGAANRPGAPRSAGLALVLAVAALQLLPALGTAPIERAEIYFLDGARSMVERGDYLVPYYRGEPFFDKPALTYWLMAASFRVFGFTAGAARLVPALATLGVLLATCWLGTLLLDRRAALAGCCVLATTPAFIAFGRMAMSDMLLALWSTLAMALAVRAYSPSPPAWVVPALGAALGLGFQTKGPIALLLPGLGLTALALRERRAPAAAPAMLAAAGLFALGGLGWFAAVQRRLGWEPLAHFFLRENLARFSGGAYDAGRPAWYYLAAYLGEGLPWSLLFPLACLRALRRPAAAEAGAAGARLLLAWLAAMLALLSLSRGKIDYYLLPLYPAACLVIGRVLAAHAWQRRERLWARATLLTGAAVVTAAAAFVWRMPEPWLPGPRARLLLALAVLAAAAVLLARALRPRPAATLAALAGAVAAAFFAAAAVLLPAFRRGQPHDAVLADVARELRYRPDARLALCEDPARLQRDLLFHARLAADERCDLWAPAAARTPYLLLLRDFERASLERVPGVREVASYSFVPATALGLRGLTEGVEPARVSLMANYETEDPVAEAKRRKARRKAVQEEQQRRDVREEPGAEAAPP